MKKTPLDMIPSYEILISKIDFDKNNPNIFETHNMNQINGLYLRFIKDQKCKVFASEPYKDTDFITEQPISLLKTWCKVLGLNYNN